MLKAQIKNCFENAANTYDSVAEIQRLSAKTLATLVNANEIFSVIDIGCGTGNVSLEIYKKYPNATYTLCDISESMLKVATEKFPKDTEKICCDAEGYEFRRYYNLAISNLCMQWFSDPKKFIEKIKKHCGLFAFSTLLGTSFESYKKLFETPPTFEYPMMEEMLEIAPQQYIIKKYAIEFENFFGVAKYFRKLGAYLKSHNKRTVLFPEAFPVTLEYDVFFAVI